jgi:hypothetical protein
LLAGLIFLVSAFTAFVGLAILSLLIGGTECDRAECSPLGEWIDENGGVFQVILIALSVLVGLLLAGMFLRRSS